jgi:SAM-dependent methyltransferase
MNEAMDAEFDTVAGWTADVAIELGQEFYLPAACRGSGSPSALQWLIDHLALSRTDRMLDCGAGLGGPAAFAVQRTGAEVVLTDPEFLACRSAVRLFDLPALQAASELPFAAHSFDVAWSLGVLCTVSDQPALLAEMRRVLTDDGRIGLLVFVAAASSVPNQPEGNNFPSVAGLPGLIADAGFRIEATVPVTELGSPPQDWAERADHVEAVVARRHKGDPKWERANRQSELMGDLLKSGEVAGTLVIARARL